MLVGKAKNQSLIGAPEKCFNLIGSGLESKQQTKLEKLARDKHPGFY
jgi:hypothetical protein